MTKQEFIPLFDRLYYGCVQPTHDREKIYKARHDSFWRSLEKREAERFERAITDHLETSTEAFFPPLSQILEFIVDEIIAEGHKREADESRRREAEWKAEQAAKTPEQREAEEKKYKEQIRQLEREIGMIAAPKKI